MDRFNFRFPGIIYRNHRFTVPLDYQKPNSETIEIFARELRSPLAETEERPYLVYFQGGPGFPALRPLNKSGWLKRALESYHLILLDQRGTGLSTPLDWRRLSHLGDQTKIANHLSYFRADSIVRDAEWIRGKLIGQRKWSLLGQSYGGFCITSYLSFYPDGIEAAFLTGGLPPVHQSVDQVYQATYQRVLKKNKEYFKRYPADQEIVNRIAEILQNEKTFLPNGDRLTVQRFQQLGVNLGRGDGFEDLHYLLELAFPTQKDRFISSAFLNEIGNLLSFETSLIYAILHESIYCENRPSQWSAHRVRDQFSEFQYSKGSQLYLTGEMVYPWMFDEYGFLNSFKEAADQIAQKSDWPALYDIQKLRENQCPSSAIIYEDDMYVEREFSLQTAQSIRGLQFWITNQYEHDGIRVDGYHIFDRLIKMAKGDT